VTHVENAKVVRISLDEPLRPVPVEDRYTHVLLIVRSAGEVVGEVLLASTSGQLSVARQQDALRGELAERLSARRLAHAFDRATRGPALDAAPTPADPSVSVVVCTHDRADQLRSCLESFGGLRTTPHEVIVVDNAPSDDAARQVCAEHPVRYVLEPVAGLSRARNRGVLESSGEVIAFTDDDCVVDPGWLDSLGEDFSDPLVMVVTGYVGPLELETRAQCLFELHGGFGRSFERTIYDGLSTAQAGVGDGNSFIRRRVLEEVGLFAEDLGPGTPAASGQDADFFARVFAAGYRILATPGRIAWHRHRRDYPELRRAMSAYVLGSTSAGIRRAVRHRDVNGLRPAAWWWHSHFRRDLGQILRRTERRVPLGMVLAEASGSLAAPWRLLRSQRADRPAPLELGSAEPAPPRPRVTAGAPPPLSVALASYNRRERLVQVLEALARQTYPSERYEVVVVIDGSTDGSAERVNGLDLPYTLRLLEQENRGLGPSRNRGVEEAKGPVVVFLDDDIVPEPGFLAEHAEAHRSAPDGHVALGYCPPVVHGHDFWSLYVRGWWEDLFRRKGEPGHQWTFADFSDGTASLPKDVFLDTGGFDPDLRRRQDWELGLRLLQRGVRFSYQPAAKAWHHADTRLRSAVLNGRHEGRGDVAFASKHPQVKGQLPLARFAAPDGRGLTGVRLLAYRRPLITGAAARAALALPPALDGLGLRSACGRLVGMLRTHTYLLGVRELLPTPEAFREFMAPVTGGEAIDRVRVSLGGDGTVEVPPAAGAVELSLDCGGEELARVLATELGEPWDWAAIRERVVREALGPLTRECQGLRPD
jgi:GT2 family glycosyltransferase